MKCFSLSSLSSRISHFSHLMRLFVKCMSKQYPLTGKIMKIHQSELQNCLFTALHICWLDCHTTVSSALVPHQRRSYLWQRILPHLLETDQNNDIHLTGLLITVKIISALTEAYFIHTQLNSLFSESTPAEFIRSPLSSAIIL